MSKGPEIQFLQGLQKLAGRPWVYIVFNILFRIIWKKRIQEHFFTVKDSMHLLSLFYS
jgi:hypothetical protein